MTAMNTPHIKRPADHVRSTNGFDEAKKAENFQKACVEIRERIRRDGPWPTINRVLDGRPKVSKPAKDLSKFYEPFSEKVCRVCRRTKPFEEFRRSRVHNNRISRLSICRECERIARRFR